MLVVSEHLVIWNAGDTVVWSMILQPAPLPPCPLEPITLVESPLLVVLNVGETAAEPMALQAMEPSLPSNRSKVALVEFLTLGTLSAGDIPAMDKPTHRNPMSLGLCIKPNPPTEKVRSRFYDANLFYVTERKVSRLD